MSRTRSPELRRLVLRARYKYKRSFRWIRKYFRVCSKTVQIWANQLRRYGDFRDGKRSGRPPKLTKEHLKFLKRVLKVDSSLYLTEIARLMKIRFGIVVDPTTLSRALRKAKWSRKRVWRICVRYSKHEEREFWRRYRRAHLMRKRLVFIDESHTDQRDLNRKFGWSRINSRSRFSHLFARGKRWTILAARTQSGLFTYKITTKTGNTRRFCRFVERKIMPKLKSDSVLVMDNASIHKSKEFTQFVKRHRLRILYLAPYCPHTNPIELDFNGIKCYLKKRRKIAYKHPKRTLKMALKKRKHVSVKSYMKRVGY